MAGVTDALIRTIEQATRGETAWQATVAEISTRHQDTLNELTSTTGTIPTITPRFATACAAIEADLRLLIAAPFAPHGARAHGGAGLARCGQLLPLPLLLHALR